ncbi:hypothetical protein [Streptomyces sp. NPDC091215]|uniref:hypothetical protein n=1 Tax=Streptomyces sp. NPDC091215 TaxID=3155192 RepID=UPI00341349B4
MSAFPLPGPAAHPPACTCAGDGAATKSPAAGGGEPASVGRRFGPTHALILLIVFLVLGCALFLAGTAPATVFALLGGCGAIGAGTLTVAGGGRLAAALAEAAVRSSAGK